MLGRRREGRDRWKDHFLSFRGVCCAVNKRSNSYWTVNEIFPLFMQRFYFYSTMPQAETFGAPLNPHYDPSSHAGFCTFVSSALMR